MLSTAVCRRPEVTNIQFSLSYKSLGKTLFIRVMPTYVHDLAFTKFGLKMNWMTCVHPNSEKHTPQAFGGDKQVVPSYSYSPKFRFTNLNSFQRLYRPVCMLVRLKSRICAYCQATSSFPSVILESGWSEELGKDKNLWLLDGALVPLWLIWLWTKTKRGEISLSTAKIWTATQPCFKERYCNPICLFDKMVITNCKRLSIRCPQGT